MALKISVIQGDVSQTPGDLLLLKFAQRFYGADEVVALRLAQGGIQEEIAPAVWDYRLVPSHGAVAAHEVLFIGTPRLGEFRYAQMQRFAQRAVEVLAEQKKTPPSVIVTTVHGAGYGLDVQEAFRSMLLGFQQGMASGALTGLKEIVFVERHARRYELLADAAAKLQLALPVVPPAAAPASPVKAASKKTVFVAMPFTEEFEDVYQFGIYATVRRCGYVCEKVDEAAFTGNIVEQITHGIRNAEFVIADLSLERPNVYLEVGFAWALGKPVILLAKEGQRLHFDVSHHKCLFYKNISRLTEILEKTIRQMFACHNEDSLG